MSFAKEILIGVVVVLFLGLYPYIWYYLKRLVFKPDIKELMEKGDISGLKRALTYKAKKGELRHIRINAAIALGNIGNLKELESLVEHGDDSDHDLAKTAIQSIGRIVLRTVRQPLFEAYRQSDSGQLNHLQRLLQQAQQLVVSRLIEMYPRSSAKTAIVATLGIVAGTAATDFLIETIRLCTESDVQVELISSLVNTGDPRMTAVFLMQAQNTGSAARIPAIQMLGKLKEQRAVPYLKGVLLQGKDQKLLLAVMEALGTIGDSAAIGPIRQFLSDTEPTSRQVAATALAHLGETKWQQWFRGDSSDFSRLANAKEEMAYEILAAAKNDHAILAMGQLNDPRAADFLIEKLQVNGGNASVIEALGASGDPKAAALLTKYLAESNRLIRKSAAHALAKLGQPEWQEWIKGDNDDFARLGRSHHSGAFDILIAGTTSVPLIEALGRLGDVRGFDHLVSLLDHQETDFRMAAVKALGWLKDPRGIEYLRKMLVDEYSQVRKASAQALAALGDTIDWNQYEVGKYHDFRRLLFAEDAYVAEKAIRHVMKDLYSNQYQDRLEAAGLLIQLAQNSPQRLIHHWAEIKKELKEPRATSHHDVDYGRTSDCTHDDVHTDTGIGVPLPTVDPVLEGPALQ